MNPEYPPVYLQAPSIKARRREKNRNPPAVEISKEKRSQIAKKVHAEIKEVKKQTEKLTPEQKRAIFLKLRHDRPLSKGDFAGVGVKLMGDAGESETMVIPSDDTFKSLIERSDQLAAGKGEEKAKNFKLLESVTDIGIGDPLDRLSVSMRTEYDSLVEQEFIVYEIEISSQKTLAKSRRREVEEIVQELRDMLGGISGRIYDVDYAGGVALLMISTTGARLRELVQEPSWWRRITFFDTRPKFETFSKTLQDFNIGQTRITAPPPGADTVCVIDSGVAAGNPLLAPVLRSDLCESWVYGASPTEDECGHGSGVASLAAYHSIDISSGGKNEAHAWVASARILTDRGELDCPQADDEREGRERECKLLSTILREVVVHYVPLGVKIFVLSFEMRGNCWSMANRREVSRSAWVARTIDQLSREHDVVFCCITGNLEAGDIEDLIKAYGYPKYFSNPLAKLFDPGQAALAVTAGSIAHSEKTVGAGHLPIARVGEPSPFTRSGPGFGGSIKPDFVEFGGNRVRDPDSNRVSANVGTNVLTASGALTPALAHSNGTSFAAPRVAFHVARIAAELRTLDGALASNPLLRSLLASSAAPSPAEGLDLDGQLAVTGYGRPDYQRALDCQPHSILLFWTGGLKPATTAIFRLHVPGELVDYAGTKKRIRISIATCPPVQSWGVAEYLGVRQKFWLFRGDEDFDEIEEMLQREDDEENVAKDGVKHLTSVLGINRRTAGTLQADTFEWTNHGEDYSLSDYSLAVSLVGPAAWLRDSEIEIPVAVTVRIEETSGRFTDLYAKVRARSGVRVRA